MRFTFMLLGLFALLAFLLPLVAVGRLPTPSLPTLASPSSQQEQSSSSQVASSIPTGSILPDETTPSSVEAVATFKILNRSSGKVEEISVRDYVRGAVAAELPATFHPEAMKAQAVAAHTYALKHHEIQQQDPDPTLLGADFSADPASLQGYATETAMKRRWGNMGDYYWNQICTAADGVLGYVLLYEEEPIVAAYHAISAGQTEDAANVWEGGAPYLTAVESPGDLLAVGLTSEVEFTWEELRPVLEAAFPEVTLGSDPAKWLKVKDRSDSGYVTEVQIGDQTFHGKELRTALGLRSTHFELNTSGGKAVFTVDGYGHGVGLSQTGADYMARQGSTFDEILAHYYPGATLALTEE